MSTSDCDAFLLLSFGGPEERDDVMPFLRNVTRGRNVPDSRLEEVAHHYYLFDGISPINELNRTLIDELEGAFKANRIELPIYWGNRNWHPMLADTVREMRDRGVRRAVALATSAYSSYSSCRQYIEDIERACAEVGDGAPEIVKLPPFYNRRGFVEANEHRLADALNSLGSSPPWDVHVAFTAHSIPLGMSEKCEYAQQLRTVAAEVSQGLGVKDYSVVYQSRSGLPSQPWLEPDICDHLRELAAQGVRDVIIHPIGFVADHMEVIYDLDYEAKSLCKELGLNMVRAATVGTHPAFVQMICDMVKEHLHAPHAPYCAAGCCPSGR
jgi:ferrochelatase